MVWLFVSQGGREECVPWNRRRIVASAEDPKDHFGVLAAAAAAAADKSLVVATLFAGVLLLPRPQYTAFLWLLLETITNTNVVPPSFKPDREIECIVDKDLSEATNRIRDTLANVAQQ